MNRNNAHNHHHNSHTFSIPALRFERTSWQEWEVKETRLYDLQAFVTAVRRSKHESAICLLDESILISELQNMKLERKWNHVGGLEQELLMRKALVTSWPVSEMTQFQSFVNLYASYVSSASNSNDNGECDSLIGFWRRQQQQLLLSKSTANRSLAPQASSTLSLSSIGYIAYEIPVMIVIILRRNESLHITEDIWCMLYPSELAASDMNQTFGAFLTNLFPQLLTLEKNIMSNKEGSASRFPLLGREITIKYYAHKRDIAADMISSTHQQQDGAQVPSSSSYHAVGGGVEGDVLVPKQPPLHGYQTIGTYAAPAAKVIAR